MTIFDWVPDACTLPTTDQPLRLAEFDDLFAAALRAVTRTSPTTLELILDATAEPTATDLTTRETACCSFFTFTFTPTADGQLRLETTVPPAHTAVLDALAARAAKRLMGQSSPPMALARPSRVRPRADSISASASLSGSNWSGRWSATDSAMSGP